MNVTTDSPLLAALKGQAQNYSFYPLKPSYSFILLAILVATISVLNSKERNKLPVINGPAWWQPTFVKKLDWIKSGLDILAEGRSKSNGNAFRVISELGDIIVLPNRFANEIRNETNLSFRRAVVNDFQAHLPGMAAILTLEHKTQLLQRIVRKQLTKHLNTVTAPLSAECTYAASIAFGESKEWKVMEIKEPLLDLIARISSRVFLGEELCRNPKWLAITKDYTITAFKTAFKLTMFPSFIRPLVALFDPDYRRSCASLKESRKLIQDVIAQRQRREVQAQENGEPIPVFDDAIAWAEAESQGESYSPADFQLILSVAAIHTTTDLLQTTLLLLSENPHLIQPLREEILEVLRVQGWKKSALFNMKLLDSAVKEAQRMKPNSIIPMRRFAMKDVQLSDGLVIRKGQRTVVDAYPMWSSETYKNPETYDIYRFRKMRENPGSEAKAQLVSTHPDHLTFGHGYFACPGRFFASNEIKIALCHLLIKYDWKMAPGHTSKPIVFGANLSIDPAVKVMYRRREEEIDLDSLEV
ncbi:Dihydromonacolin L monooxygenase LovA 1 [Paramyrothecium foliicola]|nr:Dihydromonacolin L monooxygenase LovA 1 [Paramyrothecium foliicola]